MSKREKGRKGETKWNGTENVINPRVWTGLKSADNKEVHIKSDSDSTMILERLLKRVMIEHNLGSWDGLVQTQRGVLTCGLYLDTCMA